MWLKWIYDELAWWCKSQSIQTQFFYIYKWENSKPMYFNFAYDIYFEFKWLFVNVELNTKDVNKIHTIGKDHGLSKMFI